VEAAHAFSAELPLLAGQLALSSTQESDGRFGKHGEWVIGETANRWNAHKMELKVDIAEALPLVAVAQMLAPFD
jgi:hypothetical protein